MFNIQWDTEGLDNIDAITTKGTWINIHTTDNQDIATRVDKKWSPVQGQDALEARWTYSFFLPPFILFTMLRTGEYDFMPIKPSCLATHARRGLWLQLIIFLYLLAIWVMGAMSVENYEFQTNHAILPGVALAIVVVLYLVRDGGLWMLGGGIYALGAFVIGVQLYHQRSMDMSDLLVGWGFVVVLVVGWVFTNAAGKIFNINNLNKLTALRRRTNKP